MFTPKGPTESTDLRCELDLTELDFGVNLTTGVFLPVRHPTDPKEVVGQV